MADCKECKENIDKSLKENDRNTFRKAFLHYGNCKPCRNYFRLRILEKNLHVNGLGDMLDDDFLKSESYSPGLF